MNQAEANARRRVNLALEYQEVLSKALNDFHQKDFSKQFWKTLLLGIVYRHIIDEYRQELNTQTKGVGSTQTRFAFVKLVKTVGAILSCFRDYKSAKEFGKVLGADNLVIGGYLSPLVVDKGFAQVEAFDTGFFNKKEVSKKKRESLLQFLSIPKDIEQNSLHRLIQKLPSCLIEGFDECISCTHQLDKPMKIHMALDLNSNYLKFFVALNRESGHLTLHKYQHGSHYGEMLFMDFVETEISDYFHTWGWKMADNHIPDHAFRLEEFKYNYNKCLTNDINKKFDLAIFLGASDPLSRDSVRKELDHFLSRIDKNMYKKILVRPRPVSRFALDSYYDDIISRYKLEKDEFNRKPYESIANSSLIVHLSCPSTTMYECTYVNQPFTGLLNDNNRPSKAVMPYYEFLTDNALLHPNIESLIGFLNKGNAMQSIAGAMEQNCFKNFRNTFAREYTENNKYK